MLFALSAAPFAWFSGNALIIAASYVMRGAFRLVDLAFGLQLGVAGCFASHVFDGALRLITSALDVFAIHYSLQVQGITNNVPAIRRFQPELPALRASALAHALRVDPRSVSSPSFLARERSLKGRRFAT
jgi:hypothetical protein